MVANGEQTNRRMLVTEGRHSDFAPRADDADGARELGSDAVPLITKYMHDALRDFAGRDHAP
jgi:hypothetical protein